MRELPNVGRWLHRTGAAGKVDDACLDRIADVVMDGMAAAAHGDLAIPEKLTVLRKTTAMLLAALGDLGECAGDPETGEAVISAYCASLGGALEQEVRGFRRALAKDQRNSSKSA